LAPPIDTHIVVEASWLPDEQFNDTRNLLEVGSDIRHLAGSLSNLRKVKHSLRWSKQPNFQPSYTAEYSHALLIPLA
jgi:hypothetical protein